MTHNFKENQRHPPQRAFKLPTILRGGWRWFLVERSRYYAESFMYSVIKKVDFKKEFKKMLLKSAQIHSVYCV